MARATRSDARLDFRLSRQHKELIEQAAAVSGQSLSEFAATTLVERAREVLRTEPVRLLSERDARRFLEELDRDSGPNEALRQAAERYRQRRG